MNDCMQIRLIRCDSIVDLNSYREEIGDLTGLMESIEAVGLLQPIVVRPDEQRYALVFGRRRLETFRMTGREFIEAIIIHHTDPDKLLEMQNDENAHRKASNVREKIRFARAFRPLYQKQAEERRARRVKVDEGKGETREFLARKVGLSHETLRRAEYVYDHYDAMLERAARMKKSGANADDCQAQIEKLSALINRMNSSDRENRLTITAAYKEARALLNTKQQATKEPDKEPVRTIQIITRMTAEDGEPIPVQIKVDMSINNPSKELVIRALHEGITFLSAV